MNYTVTQTHISNIKSGDTIEHNSRMMTVCSKDIKVDTFMGTTVFGDSYRMGRTLVKRIDFIRVLPAGV